MTGRQKIDWAYQQMPVLASIRADFEARKPFKDIVIGCCLHITKETAVLLETLKAGGATVFAAPSNPLSTQNDIANELCLEKIQVYGSRGASVEDYHKGILSVVKQKPKIVIDDGGDLTQRIHKELPDDDLPIGGLEETTTGINVIRQMEKRSELLYPILNVNDANTKHLFDNVYGTGQSVIDAIMRATNQLLAGKTFVVAGYGHCGKGLAQRAKGMGCRVIVTEIDPVKALQAYMDGFQVLTMTAAAIRADIIVTVTGNINVVDEDAIAAMNDGTILANAGHFDVEIDLKALRKLYNKSEIKISDDITEFKNVQGDRIYLISEGRLVNLAAAEGHPSSVMDMSFANQALGVEYLLNNGLKMESGVYDIPKDIDDKVARLKLESLGIRIDELTQEQKEYLGL